MGVMILRSGARHVVSNCLILHQSSKTCLQVTAPAIYEHMCLFALTDISMNGVHTFALKILRGPWSCILPEPCAYLLLWFDAVASCVARKHALCIHNLNQIGHLWCDTKKQSSKTKRQA